MQIYSIAGLSVLTTLLGAVGIVSTAYAADPIPATKTQKLESSRSQEQPLEFKLSETTQFQSLEAQTESGKASGNRGISRSADALKATPPTLPVQPATSDQSGAQPVVPTPALLSPLTQAPAPAAPEGIQILTPRKLSLLRNSQIWWCATQRVPRWRLKSTSNLWVRAYQPKLKTIRRPIKPLRSGTEFL